MKNEAGTVQITGEMRHVGLEGGFWGIFADDGQHYDPINLPSKLQTHGARVRFVVRIRNDVATVRMWGTPVEVVSYQQLPAKR